MVAIEKALSKAREDQFHAQMEFMTATGAQAHLARLAVEQGMSHRAVAELLRVSHTAVQKMLRREVDGIDRQRAERIYADAQRAELRAANRAKLKR